MPGMDIQVLRAERREVKGSASVRRLRRQGRVPGILYGHGEEVLMLSLPAEAFHELLETGRRLAILDVAGKQERVLVKEIQFDTWGREILHVDFSRVALDEAVTIPVEVVAHGTPKAVLAGAVLEQPLHALDVECNADHIPDQIVVEVAELEPGAMLHVRDLELPEGVRAIAEPETIVFVLREAREEEEAEAPAPEAAADEPEVIGRAAKEEGEEKEAEKS